MTSTSTPDLADVTHTRVYDAPAALVFACMTDPAHLTHFWGPVGTSTPLESITVDLRVGGAFDTVMVSDADGSRFPVRGVYTEVDPPRTLAWLEPDTGVTFRSTFHDLGDGRTEVTVVQSNLPAHFRSPQAQAGMQSSFDRFAAHLATLTA